MRVFSILVILTCMSTASRAAVDTWESSGPFATGVDNRVINAIVASQDGQTLYAGTGAGSVYRYVYSDAIPASFSFIDQTGVALSTLTVSNAITVSGINVTANISITGGEYEINGSGTWRTTASTVGSGDTVKVRQTSSASYSTTVDTTLTIGGVSDTFSTTTLPIPTYALTASASPAAGGSVSCSPNPVTHGTSASCTATANTGYSFSAFSGACSGSTCTLSNVTSALSVTATFTQNTYAVTATANPAAGGSASCTPNPVTHGGSSTCTATAHAGYGFAGWTGSCTGQNATCVLSNITAAKSTTASFKQIPTLELSANPANKAAPGVLVTFTATVSGTAGTPTGSVNFFNGGTSLASSIALSNGGASYATNALPSSQTPQIIHAEYSGDAVYLGGTRTLAYLVSEKSPTAISLTVTPPQTDPGALVTATVQVTSGYGGTAAISGSVTVSGPAGESCTIILPATQCGLGFASKGRKTLTASYGGDNNYSPSSTSVFYRVGKVSSLVPILNILLN